MRGADHELGVQLLSSCCWSWSAASSIGTAHERPAFLRPPAPPVLLLSHGEEFEERVRLASEAVARFGLYVELLCLEAADRAVVEYFDVSVGWWVQQQRSSSSSSSSTSEQFEQHEQLELQQLV